MKLLLLLLVSIAHAETMYTSLEDTPVRDKPVALGSTIVAHLKAGSMIETVKQVGGFTAVSYIAQGKVRTGFIATSQIKVDSNSSKIGVVEKAQTSVTSADVAGMINGFGETTPPNTQSAGAANAELKTSLPAGADDPGAALASRLDSLQIPAADLNMFASNGKLVSRKPKAK